MAAQIDLFSAENLASTEQVPPAPKLIPHTDWPYPGMTPEASAQSAMSGTEAYHQMLAAVIKAHGGGRLTGKQVLAMVPTDWRELCGRFAHATLPNWTAKEHGIEIIYVPHDDGGLHFEYRAED
jgi:hypothetical protein